MRFLTDLLFRNLPYKLTAFFLACVLWMAAQGLQSEERSLDLPITFVDVPESVVVVDQSAQEVNVTLTGSRAALRRAQRDLRSYPVSLRGVKSGDARFEISAERLGLPRGAVVAARSPSSLSVALDPVVRKRVRVRADLTGKLPDDLEILSVRVDPPEVVVEGARRSVRRIREVMTDPLDLAGYRESATLEVTLVFGQSHVWRADEEENSVRVELRIEQRAEQNGAAGPETEAPPQAPGSGSPPEAESERG